MKKLFMVMALLMTTGTASAQTLEAFAENGEVSALGQEFNFAMQGELNLMSSKALEHAAGAGATGIAMGMLSDEPNTLAMGAGYYDGENAVSMGYNHAVSERSLARIAVSTDSVGNASAGLGFAYKFK